MQHIPDLSLEDAADTNLVASYRAHLDWQTPCDSRDDGAMLAIAGANGFPGPYKNVAVRLDRALAPRDLLARADAFFRPLDRKYSVAVRSRVDADLEAHLAAEGFELRAESPCMVVERPVAVRAVDGHVRIARLQTLDDVRDAVTVGAQAFATLGLPVEEAHQMLARHARWLDPSVVGFVAYVDGAPAASRPSTRRPPPG